MAKNLVINNQYENSILHTILFNNSGMVDHVT
jgi:hypothetical protein